MGLIRNPEMESKIASVREDLRRKGPLATTAGIGESFGLSYKHAKSILVTAQAGNTREDVESFVEEARTGNLTDRKGNRIPPIGNLNSPSTQ